MIASFSLTDLLVACAFLPVLIATAVSDLRFMKIPNVLSILGLGLFVLAVPVLGVTESLARAAVCAVAFTVCFTLFAVGWFGGGDAKILPVTMLFVPMSILPVYLFSFSASMVLGMVLLWCARRALAHDGAAWVSMRPDAMFPMGISIAGSLPLAFLIASLVR